MKHVFGLVPFFITGLVFGATWNTIIVDLLLIFVGTLGYLNGWVDSDEANKPLT